MSDFINLNLGASFITGGDRHGCSFSIVINKELVIVTYVPILYAHITF